MRGWLVLLASLCACAAPAVPDAVARQPRETIAGLPEGPFVLVLGTAQDGGLPQVACKGERCERARREPEFRRLVASLLIVDPRCAARWLIDATPDFPEQVELANRWAPRRGQGGRPALFDGIFLTHAHFGHYTGLAYLGREVYGAQDNVVWGSARMNTYLSGNGPWSQLVEAGNVRLNALIPDRRVGLAPDLYLTPFLVPHRDEFTDTFGFLLEGPSKSLVYIPDIDKWTSFELASSAAQPGMSIEFLIETNDVTLLDGSFFAEGEIPGRAMSEIPHPFIVESLERFEQLPAAERRKVFFTHLNHTNPVVDPQGAAAAQVRAQGMGVARDGQVFEL